MPSATERPSFEGRTRCRWIAPLVLVVLGVLAAMASFLGRVGAQLDRSLIQLGEGSLVAVEGRHPTSRWLAVNGVRLSLHTTVVDDPLPRALEQQSRGCLPSTGAHSIDSVLLTSLSVRRGVFENDGYVACVALGANAHTLEAFAEAARRFSTTWNLSELGRTRFVYAKRADEDPASRTFVLSVSSAGSLDLSRMLPRDDGDAEGTDPPGVPRLPGTRRILSVYEVDTPTGVFVYRLDAASEDAVELLVTALSRSGWRLLDREAADAIAVQGARVVAARKGMEEVTVLFPSSSSGRELMTLLWSGVKG